ncbi:uncharacterized protein LOC6738549 [Drosophila simulans]|uniref:GD14745 n=1 Tax=Drosophila simulans TaxID=7240 RepID=B4QPE5_DROSI|nr:uncharacterized protein LOC6738549 [Drosophila simulans]EDX10939.1 GD14745 [Drosophila simulans]KMZ00372.1 uncharacterized protein Dsimw501_GD14745 [Drosophila simulans]
MERENYSAEYFERALARAYGCEMLRVENFHIEAVSQKGENFCSVIYRVALDFRRSPGGALESGKYILKDLLPAAAALGTNEKDMFELLLPAMQAILEEAPKEIGERKLSANCLLVEISAGKELYIMEDLGALGYGSFDRRQGLNLEEAKICVRKLAQFHGASKVLFEKKPELIQRLSPSHYANGLNDRFAQALVLEGTEYAAEAFAKELPEISKKMKAQIPDAYTKRMRDVVDPNKSSLNAVIHGDPWLNNIMFDSINKKATLVDFQNCYWGSPAIDLYFLFYTSLKPELLLNSQDEILNHYFDNLLETLRHCGYKDTLPTFGQLKDEMKRCLFYGYYTVVCELPICCSSPEASVDFGVHTFVDTDAMLKKRHQLFANERVRQTIKSTLLMLDSEGILETP